MTLPVHVEIRNVLQRELGSGERLLWTGRPRQGIRVRPADLLLIPLSVLFAGFAVNWVVGVIRDGTAPFMVVFGIPFVLVGAYVTVGRFIVDGYKRARIYYGLTNERAIIWTPEGVESVALRNLEGLSVKDVGRGTGTISFGINEAFPLIAGTNWPGASRGQPPQFDMIDDARAVYAQIRDAQRALVRIGA